MVDVLGEPEKEHDDRVYDENKVMGGDLGVDGMKSAGNKTLAIIEQLVDPNFTITVGFEFLGQPA